MYTGWLVTTRMARRRRHRKAAVRLGARAAGAEAAGLRTLSAALMADQGVGSMRRKVRDRGASPRTDTARFRAGRQRVSTSSARKWTGERASQADPCAQLGGGVVSGTADRAVAAAERAAAALGTLDEVPSSLASALLTAVNARSDIRAIGQQREAAQQLFSLASAELKPTVALSGNCSIRKTVSTACSPDRIGATSWVWPSGSRCSTHRR